MKTTANISLPAIAAIVMLFVFLGTASTAYAGKVKRVDRPRHTEQTQVVIRDSGSNNAPRPVADETPVNPRNLKSASSDDPAKVSDSNRPPLKRNTVRRR